MCQEYYLIDRRWSSLDDFCYFLDDSVHSDMECNSVSPTATITSTMFSSLRRNEDSAEDVIQFESIPVTSEIDCLSSTAERGVDITPPLPSPSPPHAPKVSGFQLIDKRHTRSRCIERILECLGKIDKGKKADGSDNEDIAHIISDKDREEMNNFAAECNESFGWFTKCLIDNLDKESLSKYRIFECANEIERKVKN